MALESYSNPFTHPILPKRFSVPHKILFPLPDFSRGGDVNLSGPMIDDKATVPQRSSQRIIHRPSRMLGQPISGCSIAWVDHNGPCLGAEDGISVSALEQISQMLRDSLHRKAVPVQVNDLAVVSTYFLVFCDVPARKRTPPGSWTESRWLDTDGTSC